MDDRTLLNKLYKELHELGMNLLHALRTLGCEARLRYCNLHEVRVNGAFQTEYFPLPEIEIQGLTDHADLGICLDKSIWLELTMSAQAAMQIDYTPLAQYARLEVYGADNYLHDFYNAGMSPASTGERIAASPEQAVHLCFYLPGPSEAALKSLLAYLQEAGIIQLPPQDSRAAT